MNKSSKSVPELSNRSSDDRWDVPFPYHWDADDYVTRRDLLRFAVMTSGALFAGTSVLAALSVFNDRRQGGRARIIAASEIQPGDVHYFNYPGEDDHALLLRLDNGRLVAYSGKCTHLSCAVYWNAEERNIRCPCHEGIFEAATGEVLAGPPPRPLPTIELVEEDGQIYAIEERPA